MGFKRCIQPHPPPDDRDLTAAMVGIGMNFSAKPEHNANIEDTLLSASVEGMDQEDLRTLTVLTTWLGVHLPYVNADRLVHLVTQHASRRVRAYWGAVAHWQAKDHRFARLHKVYSGARLDLLRTGTAFHMHRSGEDVRFHEGPLRVAGNTLRNRPQDVLTPQQLAQRHTAYRARIQMGPSYRADMWATVEEDPSITASDLARCTYGSIATAWLTKRQWLILHPTRGATAHPKVTIF